MKKLLIILLAVAALSQSTAMAAKESETARLSRLIQQLITALNGMKLQCVVPETAPASPAQPPKPAPRILPPVIEKKQPVVVAPQLEAPIIPEPAPAAVGAALPPSAPAPLVQAPAKPSEPPTIVFMSRGAATDSFQGEVGKDVFVEWLITQPDKNPMEVTASGEIAGAMGTTGMAARRFSAPGTYSVTFEARDKVTNVVSVKTITINVN